MLVLIVLLLFSFTLFALMAGRGAVIYMSLVLSPLLTAILLVHIADSDTPLPYPFIHQFLRVVRRPIVHYQPLKVLTRLPTQALIQLV